MSTKVRIRMPGLRNVLLAGVVVLGIAAQATRSLAATVVVHDTFTAADGTVLTNHAPDINLPGGAYALHGISSATIDINANRARLGTPLGGGIPIQSWGGATNLGILAISADLNVGTLTGNLYNHGIGLGFFRYLSMSASSWAGFTGLLLGTNGTLRLIVYGADSGQSVAYSGTFNTNADHALSYKVNMLSGAISDVVLDGTTCAFTTKEFGVSATVYAGFFQNTSVNLKYAYVDNFLVTYEPVSAKKIVIDDKFIDADTVNLTNHVPDINLPGGTYGLNGASWTIKIYGNQARLDSAIGGGISLQSAGAYTKPIAFIISADLNMGTMTGDSLYTHGLGLGFFSSLSAISGSAWTRFSGLRLCTNGTLRLIDNGNDSGQSVAYSGTFNTAANHALSYKVNTRSGAISDVTLDGTPYTFTTSAFSRCRHGLCRVLRQLLRRQQIRLRGQLQCDAPPERHRL